MKRDPILPSIHVAEFKAPPKRMVPSLAEIGSSDYMIVESLAAFLLHGLCVLIALWCMDIPKHDMPLHSTIEVAFEVPVALPIPDDASNIQDSDTETPVTEPPVVASEALPETDSIAPLSVPVPQKIVRESKKQPVLPSVNREPSASAAHLNAMNMQATHSQLPSNTATHMASPANKVLSPSQRCSALSKDYPMAARRRHEQGTARVRYQLSPDGQIRQVEVVESTGYSDLDRSALQAVQSMKCQAAPGQPVIKTSIPVNFSLNKIN